MRIFKPVKIETPDHDLCAPDALCCYEMHAHTAEVSKCASISARRLVHFYHQLGYRGLCITDHFLNGNTSVPSDMPWAERVKALAHGYHLAREEGRHLGIDVYFAWEYSYYGTDFLTYGLDEAWLLAHPHILDLHVVEYCNMVRQEGGFIVHAHPFREADYIRMIRLLPRQVDGVETINASRTEFENARADEYADRYDLLKWAGSDNHHGPMHQLSGLQTQKPVKDMQALIEAVRLNEASLFCHASVKR